VDFNEEPWSFEERVWHHIEFHRPLGGSQGLAALRSCCEPLRCGSGGNGGAGRGVVENTPGDAKKMAGNPRF